MALILGAKRLVRQLRVPPHDFRTREFTRSYILVRGPIQAPLAGPVASGGRLVESPGMNAPLRMGAALMAGCALAGVVSADQQVRRAAPRLAGPARLTL